jgi:hypothetical protein
MRKAIPSGQCRRLSSSSVLITTEPSIVHTDQPHSTEPTLRPSSEPSNFYTPLPLAFQQNHSDFISVDRRAGWKLQAGLKSSSRSALRLDIPADLMEPEGEALSRVGKSAESKEEQEQVVWSGGIDGLKE